MPLRETTSDEHTWSAEIIVCGACEAKDYRKRILQREASAAQRDTADGLLVFPVRD